MDPGVHGRRADSRGSVALSPSRCRRCLPVFLTKAAGSPAVLGLVQGPWAPWRCMGTERPPALRPGCLHCLGSPVTTARRDALSCPALPCSWWTVVLQSLCQAYSKFPKVPRGREAGIWAFWSVLLPLPPVFNNSATEDSVLCFWRGGSDVPLENSDCWVERTSL